VSLSEQSLIGGVLFEEGKGNIDTREPLFTANSKFDSDSMLEICMGGENYQIECQIKDLTLLYNTFQPTKDMLFSTFRKTIPNQGKIILLALQIGNYKLLEGTGTTIETSINAIGAATLGIELVKEDNFIFD